MRRDVRTIGALMRRGLNEIVRVPLAALPGVLAPTIFMLGLAAAFGSAATLAGYGGVSFLAFIVPVGMLQGAGFTGAATGVNLARDIERGWFDRLLLAPAPRAVLLAGLVASASLRALLPAGVLLIVALALGVAWPGLLELALAAVLVMGLAAVMACYATLVALRFRTQQAAPLMQVASFVAVLFTPAYAPRELLSGWLRAIADVNPVTHVLEGARQGFVGDVTWSGTWPALVTLAGLVLVFGALAARGMGRQGM
ncbi:MAG: type transport system permease protein [Solirubrobacteraceae bacterium]|jgi:ABC-2 type transport system permease protein|nr:type transport system permease protein [Solirubrobacteraceae bacterium]